MRTTCAEYIDLDKILEQEMKNISLEECQANCTEGKEVRILDPKMLDLCGREMSDQEFEEVEKYRLVCYKRNTQNSRFVFLDYPIFMTMNKPIKNFSSHIIKTPHRDFHPIQPNPTLSHALIVRKQIKD